MNLYDRFIEQKYDLKPSTKVNYLYMYNHFVRPTFGKRLIGKIKYSDVKKFYYRIILDEEMKQIRWIVYIHSCIRHSRWL